MLKYLLPMRTNGEQLVYINFKCFYYYFYYYYYSKSVAEADINPLNYLKKLLTLSNVYRIRKKSAVECRNMWFVGWWWVRVGISLSGNLPSLFTAPRPSSHTCSPVSVNLPETIRQIKHTLCNSTIKNLPKQYVYMPLSTGEHREQFIVLLLIEKFKVRVDFEQEPGKKVILDILNVTQGSNKCVCCAGTVLSG